MVTSRAILRSALAFLVFSGHSPALGRADKVIPVPMQGSWKPWAWTDTSRLEFEGGRVVLADGSVLGRFTFRSGFADSIVRPGVYRYRSLGAGRAELRLLYEDNGQVENIRQELNVQFQVLTMRGSASALNYIRAR